MPFPFIGLHGIRRMHGSVRFMASSFCSGDEMNKESKELRVDIGFDSSFANCGLVSLEQALFLYEE